MQLGSGAGAIYLAVLAVSLIGLVRTRRPRSPVMIVLFGAMALAPLIAVRHLPLFAITALVVAGEHVADAWDRARPRARSASYSLSLSLPPVLAAILLVGVRYHDATSLTVNGKLAPYPAAAVALLEESGASGNVAVSYGWGEYLICHLSPNIKVSVDGRREMVYDKTALEADLRFESGIGKWDTLLTQYATGVVLVSKDGAAYNLMAERQGWSLAYDDRVAALFVPSSSPLYARIRALPKPALPPDGDGLSFP